MHRLPRGLGAAAAAVDDDDGLRCTDYQNQPIRNSCNIDVY